MAKIQATRREMVEADPASVLTALHEAGQRHGCTLALVDGWDLEIRRGSQFTMRVAGAFASYTACPVVAAVRVTPDHKGVLIEVNVLDDLGFGVRTGAVKKITRAANELADMLVAAARETRSASPGKMPGQTYPPPSKHHGRFCSGCGVPADAAARFCGACGRPV